MKIKKILHIPNYYPPHIGGIEDVCYNTIQVTPEYHHRVICFNDNKSTVRDIHEGIEVCRCSVLKKWSSQSISLSMLSEMKKVFQDFSPDIVHFHAPNPLGSLYLELLLPSQTQLIVHWHSDIVAQTFLYKFYQPIENFLLQRANKIVITSPCYISGSQVLSSLKNKIQIIPNVVNCSKLSKRAEDDKGIIGIWEQYRGKKIVFTFGRHVPYKGLIHLINAAPMISDDAVVVIAGQGPETENLKKHAKSNSLFFPGRLSDDALRHYLYASDVFAFPSISKNEAFGIALAEAMYCGLPAVTFTIHGSGVNWVSKDGETGLESVARTEEDLAAKINQLLSDDLLREHLGINASRRVRKLFTPDAIKDKIIDLYEN